MRELRLAIRHVLTFLEQVVIALTERNREHIPYRQAKLTHYLKDSLGGNSDTKMIANIWPEGSHVEETYSTLKFCRRMMKVTNTVDVNLEMDPKLLLKKYEQDINALKLELKMHDTLKGRGTVDYDPSDSDKAQMEQMIKKYLSGDADVTSLCSEAITITNNKLLFEMLKQEYENREKQLREQIGRGGYGGGGGGGGDPMGEAEEAAEEAENAVGVAAAGDAGISLGDGMGKPPSDYGDA